MTFDLVVGNPPFSGSLHLKLHRTLSDLATPNGKVVFVHPINSLLVHKPMRGVGHTKIMDCSKLTSVKMFWANHTFDIYLFVPVGITVWDKSKNPSEKVKVVDKAFTNTEYLCDYDKIHVHGARFPEFLDWFERNVSFPFGNLREHGAKLATDDYFIKLSILRGHAPSSDDCTRPDDDYFTLLPRDENATVEQCTISKSEGYHNIYSFHTQLERDNFIRYLKTKCVRFLLSLSKSNPMMFRGEMARIPWMDFNVAYSDETLRKEWNIGDDMWDYIDKTLPDYYVDYTYSL